MIVKRFVAICNALPWLFLMAVWILSFFYASTPLDGLVLCVWQQIYELQCPGCGLTRSFMAMSAGSVLLAADHHLAGPSLYVAMVWCVVVWAVRWRLRRPTIMAPPRWILTLFWAVTGFLYLLQCGRVVLSWFESP